MKLAEFLLGGTGTRTVFRTAELNGPSNLPDPVPVHMLYWTAWVDEEGTLQWRDGPLPKPFTEVTFDRSCLV